MPKQSTLEIKESLEELSSLLRQQSHPKNVLRIQSLIYIKEGRFNKRTELAAQLGYSVRSMEMWLKQYKDQGLEFMLIPKKEKQQRTRRVTIEIHQGLSQRLKDSEKGFISYVSAQKWVEQTYNKSISYATLRNYMIDFFGTKIKQPRKSHIKKSPEAIADFLKLTKLPK